MKGMKRMSNKASNRLKKELNLCLYNLDDLKILNVRNLDLLKAVMFHHVQRFIKFSSFIVFKKNFPDRVQVFSPLI